MFTKIQEKEDLKDLIFKSIRHKIIIKFLEKNGDGSRKSFRI